MKLVIVTGMSGAGKTIALKMLEDLGFYCVDNLPIPLVDKFAQLAASGEQIHRAALGLDIRSGNELTQLDEVTESWKNQGIHYRILFLDASDATLIKRYKETRRSHPLAGGGRVDRVRPGGGRGHQSGHRPKGGGGGSQCAGGRFIGIRCTRH